ncbi:dTDP-4-dehydrorhamnose reductase [Candidatus Woesearchaeota archaeon]|nr:dTDP-4-dehydrorhamnose reductase [Candidatus Woesearchaeota archaeon]
MKILILGADGLLGKDLVSVFSNEKVVAWKRKDLDITKKGDVSRKIAELKPDLVINAAAYTDVDGAETSKELCLEVNGYAAGYVADACSLAGASLLHLSTDYVFDGNQNGYTEYDQPNPINVHGQAKALAERLIREKMEKYFIVRTSGLFGRHRSNFVDTIIRLARERDKIAVVTDQVICPGYTKDVAVKIKEIVYSCDFGIYHVTNSGSCSWYEYAKKIIELAGLKTVVVPITSDELDRPARRPKCSILINTKLEPLRGWEDALKDYLGLVTIKGVILAGGTGSRLLPITKVTNKHLLPVHDKPMIFYPLFSMINAGIRKILLITGTECAGDFMKLLGSGKEFGIDLTYKVQDGALGIAQALSLSEDFVGNDKFVAILGDNIFTDDISGEIEAFKNGTESARIFLKEVGDAERFGVAELQGNRIIGIEEKPRKPKSRYAVTGIYMYNPDVFEIIRALKPSARGEYEITDVNNEYIRKGTLAYSFLNGHWTDAGTFDSLYRASTVVREDERGKEKK